MWGLLYKDFSVMKKDLLICGVSVLGISLLLFIPWESLLQASGVASEFLNAESMIYAITPMVVYICIFLVISGVQSGIFAHDERKVFSAYITASPMGENGQVLSKYYMTLLLSFGVVVWGFLCDSFCTLISGIKGSAASIYITMFFVQILLRAVEMPFIIRFGEKHGRTYKILLISAIAFVGIVYLLFGPLPESVSLDSFFEFIIRFSKNEAAVSTTMLGVAALFPYIVLLLYYGSYKISCKLYQKGVNNYDK